MISGTVKAKNREEAEFFNSVIATGLLNMDIKEKERFKDTKINITAKWEEEKIIVEGSDDYMEQ